MLGLPVKSESCGVARAAAPDHIKASGEAANIALVPKPQWREDDDLSQYVWFEVPSQSSLLLHKVPPQQRHPLNFCRCV
jgi:hypothetical protein